MPRWRSEPSSLQDAQDEDWEKFTIGKENIKAHEIPSPRTRPPQSCFSCPNSPQGWAPGCGSGSGPEAAGTLAAAAAAAAFPPSRSQSISVQCRLPQQRQAREKGGPRIGCVLPRGPGPASPPRPPLQHRGQRPARALGAQPSREEPCAPLRPLVRQPERGRCAPRRVLIPPASSPPAQGGLLRPPGLRSKSKGCRDPPASGGPHAPPSAQSHAGISALFPPSGLDKDDLSAAGRRRAAESTAQPLKMHDHGSEPDPALRALSRPNRGQRGLAFFLGPAGRGPWVAHGPSPHFSAVICSGVARS